MNQKFKMHYLTRWSLTFFFCACFSITSHSNTKAHETNKNSVQEVNSKNVLEALNPERQDFMFENYTHLGAGALSVALNCMFPIGSKKEDIDFVLINTAGAHHHIEKLNIPYQEEVEVIHKYSYPIQWGGHKGAETQVIGMYFKDGSLIDGVYVAGTGIDQCKESKNE